MTTMNIIVKPIDPSPRSVSKIIVCNHERQRYEHRREVITVQTRVQNPIRPYGREVVKARGEDGGIIG